MQQSEVVQAKFPAIFKDIFLPYRYKVYFGGRGGAKSWSIAKYFIISILSETHTKPVYGCFREVQDSLSDSVKALLMSTIDDMGLSHEFYTTATSKKIICKRNDGYFMFAGLSNMKQVNKIKSIHNIIKAWIEEAHDITEEAWDTFSPSIRGSDDSEIIISFNPNMPTDYFYKRFVTETPPLGSLVVKVNYTDNPYFPEVLELERTNCLPYPNKYKRIWLGMPGYFEQQLLNPDWWKYYASRAAVLKSITGMFITADTAYTEEAISDYTVVQCWGYIGRNSLYLLDQIRGKWDFPLLIDNTKNFILSSCRLERKIRPAKIYIEYKVSGISLQQTLKRQGMKAVAWKPKDYRYPEDKIGRVQESSLLIKAGLVYLPKDAPWLPELQAELDGFSELGAIGYDDQVDGLTMACSVWRSMGGGLNVSQTN